MTHADNEEDAVTESDRPDLEEKLSELEIMRQSVDDAKAKAKDYYDQLLRLGAEFENYRKRAETRTQEARRFGQEEILLQIMSLADVLNQAVQSSEKASDVKDLHKGLQLVQQQFEKFLNDQGLVPIKAVGERLDPHKHEVLSQDVNEDVEEGTITAEIQKGYTMNDRVIRTAKVRVAAKPKDEES